MKLKDERWRPLILRREEIRKEVNKLMEEYNALEILMKENIKLKEEKDITERESR